MQISIDEGGLRQEEDDERRYLPFAQIADVELRTRIFRAPSISIHLTSGEERTLLAGAAALDIHRALAEHLGGRPERARETARWPRGGRSVLSWIAELDDAADAGYRDGAQSLVTLFAVAEDADAFIDERAAALHLLLRVAEGADLIRTAKIVLGRVLPPIVQVVVRLSPGGASLVTDEVALEAASFLEQTDREEVRTVLASSVFPASAEQLAAIAAAMVELADETRRTASAPPGTGSRSRHGTGAGAVMSDRDTSRWIGRSWGL
jgi:hypothetical protein